MFSLAMSIIGLALSASNNQSDKDVGLVMAVVGIGLKIKQTLSADSAHESQHE